MKRIILSAIVSLMFFATTLALDFTRYSIATELKLFLDPNYSEDTTDTLSGIDQDENGIRDDIDNYIEIMGYDETAQTVARSYQQIITSDLSDTDEAKALLINIAIINTCSNESNEWSSDEFRVLTTNTLLRRNHFNEFYYSLLVEEGDNHLFKVYRQRCNKALGIDRK